MSTQDVIHDGIVAHSNQQVIEPYRRGSHNYCVRCADWFEPAGMSIQDKTKPFFSEQEGEFLQHLAVAAAIDHSCGCKHDDAECCNFVGEFCFRCIAAQSLELLNRLNNSHQQLVDALKAINACLLNTAKGGLLLSEIVDIAIMEQINSALDAAKEK